MNDREHDTGRGHHNKEITFDGSTEGEIPVDIVLLVGEIFPDLT